MLTTLVINLKNEAASIDRLLAAIKKQSCTPDETIFVDAESTDNTCDVINKFSRENPELYIKLLKNNGTRSANRNWGVANAKYPLIAFTDGGCIPKKDWLEKLLATYEESKSPVIAGYYQGEAKTPLEEVVVAYTLVMSDKLNPKTFLPCTRSMLIEKKIFQELGGFDPTLNYSEDYEFSLRLQAQKIPISFCEAAKVLWIPRHDLASYLTMVFNFAKNDIIAGNRRPKVTLIFVRYILFLIVFAFATLMREIMSQKEYYQYLLSSLSYASDQAGFFTFKYLHIHQFIINLPVILVGLYIFWSVQKNGRNVTRPTRILLPIFQISTDICVMFGSIIGLIQNEIQR